MRKLYEANNYEVIRSAGSRGHSDLICWNTKDCELVQCKKENIKKSYKEDEARLRAVQTPPGWKKVLWIKTGTTVTIKMLGKKEDKGIRISLADVKRRIRGD